MSWWIVEDALRDTRGHWAEYLGDFRDGLRDSGRDVLVFCDSEAERWVIDQFGAQALLPPSIWHRMSLGSSRISRLLRIPVHGIATFRVMNRALNSLPLPQCIFVPTVLVHHLVGWWRLLEGPLRMTETRLVLFFPNAPIRFSDDQNCAVLASDPTAQLFRWLIKKIAPAVAAGRAVLGTETQEMCRALTSITGVPFTYLPHPVRKASEVWDKTLANNTRSCGEVTFGCYGAARHEKGTDLLQLAIRQHLRWHPSTTSKFVIQWIEDFEDSHGSLIQKDPELTSDGRVEFVTRYFRPGEYATRLAATDIMLLPYRDPYRFRVSRVLIEALVRGIPVVATEGTTLCEQAASFGQVVPCMLNDVQSLALAIRKAEESFGEMAARAQVCRVAAEDHFSVENFCNILAL